jgi:hypothetical protein
MITIFGDFSQFSVKEIFLKTNSDFFALTKNILSLKRQFFSPKVLAKIVLKS